MIAVVDEPDHGIDGIDEREMEWLELESDLNAEVGGVVAENAAVFDAGLPLLGGRNDLLVPNVFAEDKEDIFGFVFIGQIEVFFHAVNREPLDAGIEVDQADGDAGDRDDGQLEAVALALDEP